MKVHKSPSRYELVASEAVRLDFLKISNVMKYGFTVGFDGRAQRFFLLRDDNTGFQFHTDMVPLSSRLEAGRMHIDRAENWLHMIDQVFDLPQEFRSVPFDIKRLVIDTAYGKVDSGITLTTPNKNVITLVASSAPYCVEVLASPHFPAPDDKFDPEYGLEEYCSLSF